MTESTFDLIITDIYMPEMEGVEFTRIVREKYPDIKIIGISGGDSPDGVFSGVNYLEHCMVLGQLDGNLKKPFSIDALLKLIEKLLG